MLAFPGMVSSKFYTIIFFLITGAFIFSKTADEARCICDGEKMQFLVEALNMFEPLKPLKIFVPPKTEALKQGTDEEL